jgi:tRNA pseudouridine32 synthase/23S rRNA pseudouridine746 synthase
MALDVVYADAGIVVLNKPSGLLAVPGKTSDLCLSLQVQAQYCDALIVHRLDMATSGLMVMARGLAAQRLLNDHFAKRQVHKRYVALAHGDCRPTGLESTQAWHTIDLPILVDWPNRPLRKIDLACGKPSSTRWRCLAYDAQRNASRLELEPLTGRSHQLRVHLQAIGHPILGDALYAPSDVAVASTRLLLHATELAFAHPSSGERISFTCADAFESPSKMGA